MSRDVVVSAASSLTDALASVAPFFEKKHQVNIRFNFEASSRLALQIEQGAKVDLFISADEAWNQYLQEKGIAKKETTFPLLTNELVLVTHKNNEFKLNRLEDLNSLKFKHLALAQENVPAGKYAIEALKKMKVFSGVKNKIVSADNVRNVLGWIMKNEADLGIVFATDARSSSDVKVITTLPSELHSKIVYPVSLLSSDKTALAFYEYLQTNEVKDQLSSFGFAPWK
jgi:molybdate transport system substrate-binding protein